MHLMLATLALAATPALAVTYGSGEPMGGVFITARHEASGETQSLVNSSDGTFSYLNMEPGAHSLGVQVWDPPKGSKPIQASGIHPGPDEVQLIAEFDKPVEEVPGTVSGVIEDAGNRLAGADQLRVILRYKTSYKWRDNVQIEGMHFFFDEVDPGEYRACAFSGEQQIYQGEWFELLPGEERDLGVIKTEVGGTLILNIDRSELSADMDPEVNITIVKSVGAMDIDISTSPLRIEGLSAGEHRITAHARDMVYTRHLVEIVSGKETETTLKLRRGVRTPFAVTWPTEQELGHLQVFIRDLKGEQFWDLMESNTGSLPRPYERWTNLPLGKYVLSAETGSGLKGEVSFSVSDLSEEQPTVQLSLH